MGLSRSSNNSPASFSNGGVVVPCICLREGDVHGAVYRSEVDQCITVMGIDVAKLVCVCSYERLKYHVKLRGFLKDLPAYQIRLRSSSLL